MSLDTMLENTIAEFGVDRTYWVAYSGGRDSHVLLHVLATLRTAIPFNLRAIHINHSLSPNAQAWSEHCTQICNALDVELTHITVNATAATGESPEAVARQKRYAALTSQLTAQDILLTAHHQDDQAETLLLQLMRGAGPKGLAAMPRVKTLGLGLQVRPLLSLSRAAITAYADENNLHWIEDESNQQLHFSRNFMRNKIIPVLQEHWPNVTTTIARSAEHCSESQQLLEEIAAHDYAAVAGTATNTLSVPALLQLSPARQRQVMRYWLQQLQLPLPSAAKLQQAQIDMLHARHDKIPLVHWEGVELRRFRHELYALKPLSQHDNSQVIAWDFPQVLQLDGIGTIQATPTNETGLRADIQAVTVRFRTGGEVCTLPNRTMRHDLKKLLQSWNIPVWQRDRIPLIYSEDRLVAAVGLFIDKDFIAKENEPALSLRLIND